MLYAIYSPNGRMTENEERRLCKFESKEGRASVTDDHSLSSYWTPIARDDAREMFPAAFRGGVAFDEAYDYDSFEDMLLALDGEDMWIASPSGDLQCWTGYPK